jgi:transposase
MGTTLDSVSKSGNRKGRPNYSLEFKRQIVAATSGSGASVSLIASTHQLNANMVFRWRRELGAGAAGVTQESGMLLPIVLDRPAAVPLAAATAQRKSAAPHIEVVIGDACVRISGAPDEAVLRTVFQSLRS